MERTSVANEITPILIDIEKKLWISESGFSPIPKYSDDAVRASIKILMTILITKMWELQEREELDIEIRESMAERFGMELKHIIKVYTDIDTHKLYE